jgi:hypothetical protein
MNREDIIHMAIEAELNLYVNDLTEKQYIEVVERFAALVASAEREACADLCKEMYLSGDMDTGLAEEAILARGQRTHN